MTHFTITLNTYTTQLIKTYNLYLQQFWYDKNVNKYENISFIIMCTQCNYKSVALHSMEALEGRRGTTRTRPNRGTRRGWVVSITLRPRFTPGTHWIGVGWAPEPVWKQRLEEQSFASGSVTVVSDLAFSPVHFMPYIQEGFRPGEAGGRCQS
jgi:hypothetical protein